MVQASALLACALVASGVMTSTTAGIAAQERVGGRPNLSGSWQLNRDLSDDAKSKLEGMHSSPPAGGHGPGRHGGLGRILGGIFGGGQSGHADVEELVVNAPTRLVVMQDDQKVVLTEPDGRVRTLPTDNRTVKVDGRDTRTKWENNRLVSEITVGDAKVTETYERAPNAAQLIVTARVDMQGRQVSIRRVYDAATTDPNREITFTGTVADVKGGRSALYWFSRIHTLGMGHMPAPERGLLLKTDTETVEIQLGPGGFLAEKQVEIEEGVIVAAKVALFATVLSH